MDDEPREQHEGLSWALGLLCGIVVGPLLGRILANDPGVGLAFGPIAGLMLGGIFETWRKRNVNKTELRANETNEAES